MGLGTEFRPYDGFLPDVMGIFQEMFKFIMGGTEISQKIGLIRPFLGVFPSFGRNCKNSQSPIPALGYLYTHPAPPGAG